MFDFEGCVHEVTASLKVTFIRLGFFLWFLVNVWRKTSKVTAVETKYLTLLSKRGVVSSPFTLLLLFTVTGTSL